MDVLHYWGHGGIRCGAPVDDPETRTTSTAQSVTCDTCLEIMGEPSEKNERKKAVETAGSEVLSAAPEKKEAPNASHLVELGRQMSLLVDEEHIATVAIRGLYASPAAAHVLSKAREALIAIWLEAGREGPKKGVSDGISERGAGEAGRALREDVRHLVASEDAGGVRGPSRTGDCEGAATQETKAETEDVGRRAVAGDVPVPEGRMVAWSWDKPWEALGVAAEPADVPPAGEGEVSHVHGCDCADCVEWRQQRKERAKTCGDTSESTASPLTAQVETSGATPCGSGSSGSPEPSTQAPALSSSNASQAGPADKGNKARPAFGDCIYCRKHFTDFGVYVEHLREAHGVTVVDAPDMAEQNDEVTVGDEVTIQGLVVEKASDDGKLRIRYAASGSDQFHMWFDPSHVQRRPEAKAGSTITLPLSVNEDTEITCLYCRRPAPCEYALTIRRPGETALAGLHAMCLAPFREMNPKSEQQSGDKCPDCGERDCNGAPRFKGLTAEERMVKRQSEPYLRMYKAELIYLQETGWASSGPESWSNVDLNRHNITQGHAVNVQKQHDRITIRNQKVKP